MDKETYENQVSKWHSRRYIISTEAIIIIFAIVIFSFILMLHNLESPVWWGVLTTTLAGIPVSFVTLESLNKKWRKNKSDMQEEK